MVLGIRVQNGPHGRATSSVNTNGSGASSVGAVVTSEPSLLKPTARMWIRERPGECSFCGGRAGRFIACYHCEDRFTAFMEKPVSKWPSWAKHYLADFQRATKDEQSILRNHLDFYVDAYGTDTLSAEDDIDIDFDWSVAMPFCLRHTLYRIRGIK